MRHRALGLAPWIPAILGIGSLLALLTIAAAWLNPWSTDDTALPPPQPPVVLPEGRITPPLTTEAPESAPPPSPAEDPETPVPVGRTTTIRPPLTRPPTTRPAPPPPVIGRYQVVDSYGDSFIGQVLITNEPGADRSWTVVLEFPSDVGDLRTSWLEGLPQPTLSRAGRTFTWRSTTPLAAGATGMLRFHFDRPGAADQPSRCLTNGRACR